MKSRFPSSSTLSGNDQRDMSASSKLPVMHWTHKALLVAWMFGISLISSLQATPPHIQLDGGWLELEGDATLHGWFCESGEAYVRIGPDADLHSIHAYLRDILLDPPADTEGLAERLHGYMQGAKVNIRTPIDSLDCGSRRLERDLHRAVRAAEHPYVHFRFIGISHAALQYRTGQAVLTLQAEAELQLAGQQRLMDIDVNITIDDDDTIHFVMGRDLFMTDFNVTPPTALFGLIRVRDQFNFRFMFSLPAPPWAEHAEINPGTR